MRSQQNRVQNRLLPIQGSSGFGLSGGYAKESGGTGVFIPRILNNSATSAPASVVAADVRKIKGESSDLRLKIFTFCSLYLDHSLLRSNSRGKACSVIN